MFLWIMKKLSHHHQEQKQDDFAPIFLRHYAILKGGLNPVLSLSILNTTKCQSN